MKNTGSTRNIGDVKSSIPDQVLTTNLAVKILDKATGNEVRDSLNIQVAEYGCRIIEGKPSDLSDRDKGANVNASGSINANAPEYVPQGELWAINKEDGEQPIISIQVR